MMRRFLDLLLVASALVVLSPLLVAIALAVAATSAGSPFYLASRIGRFGVPFRMWKFRTMRKNAALCGPPITGRNDPRITRLGRFLRGSKLDELPQLVNVLMGHMTLVGPRPEAPEIVSLYRPEQRRVLSVKPGITGKVQIQGDEEDSIPEGVRADEYYVRHLLDRKILCDLDYLQHRTVWTDAEIVRRTAVIVFRFVLRLQVSPEPWAVPAASSGAGPNRTD